jgi:hypothetical protein
MTPIQEIKLGFVQRLKSGANVLSEIVIHRSNEKIHFSLYFTMTRTVVDFKYSNQGFQSFLAVTRPQWGLWLLDAH